MIVHIHHSFTLSFLGQVTPPILWENGILGSVTRTTGPRTEALIVTMASSWGHRPTLTTVVIMDTTSGMGRRWLGRQMELIQLTSSRSEPRRLSGGMISLFEVTSFRSSESMTRRPHCFCMCPSKLCMVLLRFLRFTRIFTKMLRYIRSASENLFSFD